MNCLSVDPNEGHGEDQYHVLRDKYTVPAELTVAVTQFGGDRNLTNASGLHLSDPGLESSDNLSASKDKGDGSSRWIQVSLRVKDVIDVSYGIDSMALKMNPYVLA